MKHLFYLLPLLVLGCDSVESLPSKSNTPSQHAKQEQNPGRLPDVRVDAQAKEAKEAPKTTEASEPKEEPPEEAPPIPKSFTPLNKNKTVFFEKKADGTRAVHLLAEVCLREGPLEVLVCKTNTKEHESILHLDADGREIHAALMAAGAKPGSPVKFNPMYVAASGTKIKISVTYREKGKVKTAPAGTWINDKKTGKDMAHDWVFAGSRFFKDPERPNVPEYYMANNGEFISMANFPDSMLDLPVKSSKDVADLIFEMNTAKIPPLKSPVIVTLEPVLEKEKK